MSLSVGVDDSDKLENPQPTRGVYAATALYALWLIIVGILKLAEFGTAAYVEHFTNWSWTLAALFFVFVLAAPWSPHVARQTIRLLFFALWGIVWGVAGGVTVLLLSGSTFIEQLFDDIAPSIVIVGNDVVHAWPLLAMVFYVFLNRPAVAQAITSGLLAARQRDQRAGTGGLLIAGYLAFQLGGGSLLLALLYSISFDIGSVYHTTIPEPLCLGLLYLVALVANGLLFWQLRAYEHRLVVHRAAVAFARQARRRDSQLRTRPSKAPSPI